MLEMVSRFGEQSGGCEGGENMYMFNMNIMFFGVWKLFKWFREI